MNSRHPDNDLFLVPEEDQAAFDGYVKSKAERFQELGIARYREQDFFKMPDERWEPEQQDAVARGMP